MISHYILAKNISKDISLFLGDGGDHALAGIYDDFPYYFADLYNAKNHTKLNKVKLLAIKAQSSNIYKDKFVWEIYKDVLTSKSQGQY